MTDFILFWLSKAIAEVIFFLVVVGVFMAAFAIPTLISDRKKRKRGAHKGGD